MRSNIGFSGLWKWLGPSCGFGTRKPPDPPMAGCWWHTEHWSPLNREPRPDELVSVARFGSSPVSAPSVTSLQVSQTDSSWTVRALPSLNSASSLRVSPCMGPPAPGGPPRTPGSFCAKQRKENKSVASTARFDKRELNVMRFPPNERGNMAQTPAALPWLNGKPLAARTERPPTRDRSSVTPL